MHYPIGTAYFLEGCKQKFYYTPNPLIRVQNDVAFIIPFSPNVEFSFMVSNFCGVLSHLH
ncbi:hypothetical protein ES703_40696 [subsurface metagenome]